MSNFHIKPTLILDLDDVTNNLVDIWLKLYNFDFDDNLTSENIKSWDIINYVKPEAKDKLFNILSEPNFFENLSIQPNAAEVIQWLENYYDIYIVTAYYVFSCVDKVKWVEKHLPFFDTKKIVFCNNKVLIKAKAIIDDAPHNILDFKRTNPTGIPIVFDKPWNRELSDGIIRCKDWLEIKEVFEEIIKMQ